MPSHVALGLRSSLLDSIPGIAHGFGTRAIELPPLLGRSPAEYRAYWEATRPRWKQTHGIAIAHVREPRQACGEVDALRSAVPGVPIAVQTADCVPILLARDDGGAVAAVHSGWRGTRARILQSLLNELAAAGEALGRWRAAIGPAIGPCCYEVSPELADEFAREFGALGPRAVPRARHLDLPAINEWLLREGGLGEVEVLRACTFCSRVNRASASASASGPESESGRDYEFNSFRREGSGTRQWSVIEIVPKHG